MRVLGGLADAELVSETNPELDVVDVLEGVPETLAEEVCIFEYVDTAEGLLEVDPDTLTDADALSDNIPV